MNHPETPATNKTDDTLGTGIEAGIVLVMFAGGGYLLDRWIGITPVLTIGLFVVGAIGLFYKFKANYELQIDQLAEQRRNAARSSAPSADRGER